MALPALTVAGRCGRPGYYRDAGFGIWDWGLGILLPVRWSPGFLVPSPRPGPTSCRPAGAGQAAAASEPIGGVTTNRARNGRPRLWWDGGANSIGSRKPPDGTAPQISKRTG